MAQLVKFVVTLSITWSCVGPTDTFRIQLGPFFCGIERLSEMTCALRIQVPRPGIPVHVINRSNLGCAGYPSNSKR